MIVVTGLQFEVDDESDDMITEEPLCIKATEEEAVIFAQGYADVYPELRFDHYSETGLFDGSSFYPPETEETDDDDEDDLLEPTPLWEDDDDDLDDSDLDDGDNYSYDDTVYPTTTEDDEE